MTDTSDNPISPGAPGLPAPGSFDTGAHPADPPQLPARLRSLSPRVTAALAGVMLATGIAVGAAIGPAPSTSLAGASRVPLLLPSLLAAAGVGGSSSTAAVPPPAVTPQPTPAPVHSKAGSATTAPAATSPAATPSPAPAEPAPSP